MRTGIFGGTFNPIHTGHLMLAEQAYSSFVLDRVFFIPSGRSYFKDDIKMPDAAVRFEMCRLACEGNEHFHVLDTETKRPGNSYTCETLEELKGMYPDDEFFYIAGFDSFAELGHFKDPEKIFALSRIVVAARNDGTDISAIKINYESKFGARVDILDMPRIDISSSMIRQYIKEGRSVRYYLPGRVEKYIMENGIYTESI
ncbi:MAG: nicotinate-nucleotide adenylyltransferase [Lachnospiraceae bacterium]|nr:nicotinate-nucleotide adenylyltransferase [Lachnospiraceae bacterium]